MMHIEMTPAEMRKYLKFFRGEESCPLEYRDSKGSGACWQAEAIIADRWLSLTKKFKDGVSPEGVSIEQSIIDWVYDVLSRHCPYCCEEYIDNYVTGKFYRHFKGNIYRIESFAKDSETQNYFVVYKAMYDGGETWIRPSKNFFEKIERDGKEMPRFRPITDEEAISSIPFVKRKELGIMRAFNGVLRPDYTPELITALKEDEVFVFGSNLEGMHGGGAAYAAFRKFGAVMGCGVGHRGQSYAIPTMQGGVETIKPYVDEFIGYAKAHPDLFFYVTRIGCGIAGFRDKDIAPLFHDAVDVENICLPESFVSEIAHY